MVRALKSKTEVDFLLKKGNSFCAIEVKATTKVRPDDLRGLKAMSTMPGLKRKILIYTGKESQKLDTDIEVMNVARLSSILADNKLF